MRAWVRFVCIIIVFRHIFFASMSLQLVNHITVIMKPKIIWTIASAMQKKEMNTHEKKKLRLWNKNKSKYNT